MSTTDKPARLTQPEPYLTDESPDTTSLQLIGKMLGRKVHTPEGVGILIGVETPHNGLYFESDRASCRVWYGCGNRSTPDHSPILWGNYSLRDLMLADDYLMSADECPVCRAVGGHGAGCPRIGSVGAA